MEAALGCVEAPNRYTRSGNSREAAQGAEHLGGIRPGTSLRSDLAHVGIGQGRFDGAKEKMVRHRRTVGMSHCVGVSVLHSKCVLSDPGPW